MHGTILIVEDDPHFGQQLVDLFEYLGYPLRLETTGPGAVAACRRDDVALLLTDLMLPLMSGVEVVRKVRAIPGRQELPVLMMSAVYKNPKLFERELRELGVLEFLAKPFSLVDLGRKVAAILDDEFDGDAEDSHIARTGSWRLEELDDELGGGELGLDLQGRVDRLGLLEVIVELFKDHEAGVLTIQGAGLERQLFFLNGYPVWAVNENPGEDLGSILIEQGVLTQQQVYDLEVAARRNELRWPEAVARSGLVSEDRLLAAGRERVRGSLLAAFGAASMVYRFEPGDTFVDRVAVHEVNPVRCMGAIVERHFSGPELGEDLRELQAHHIGPGPRYRRLMPYLELPPALDGLQAALTQGCTLTELRVRFGAAVVDRHVWLMLRLGVAEAEAPGTRTVERLRNEVAGDPWSAGELPVPRFVPEARSESGPAARTIVGDYLAHMERDFYALLRVPRDATTAQLEAAYATARDRYRDARASGELSGPVLDKAKELEARLETAWGVLSDADRREIYDLSLRRREAQAAEAAGDELPAARALLDGGQAAQALAKLQRLEAVLPHSAEVQALIGAAVLERARGERTALLRSRDALERALRLQAGHRRALETLARVHHQLGDLAEEALALARLRAVDRAR